MGRVELLNDVIAHAEQHGIADTSLRELAELIGTSHRMLLYHFRSREGLLAAIVAENEAREREAARSYADESLSHAEALRRSWRRLRRPKNAGSERLFFELAASAMYQRPGTEQVADDMVRRWVEMAERAGADPASVRLDMAVLRGLLLDMLLTNDRKGTDEAFERYCRLHERTP